MHRFLHFQCFLLLMRSLGHRAGGCEGISGDKYASDKESTHCCTRTSFDPETSLSTSKYAVPAAPDNDTTRVRCHCISKSSLLRRGWAKGSCVLSVKMCPDLTNSASSPTAIRRVGVPSNRVVRANPAEETAGFVIGIRSFSLWPWLGCQNIWISSFLILS